MAEAPYAKDCEQAGKSTLMSCRIPTKMEVGNIECRELEGVIKVVR